MSPPGAPTAANYSQTVAQGGTLNVTTANGLASNDTGTGLTFALQGAATHGTAVVNSDGSYTYTPNASFSGSDSFTYTATDSDDQTASGTVSLTVSPTLAPSVPVVTGVTPATGPEAPGAHGRPGHRHWVYGSDRD